MKGRDDVATAEFGIDMAVSDPLGAGAEEEIAKDLGDRGRLKVSGRGEDFDRLGIGGIFGKPLIGILASVGALTPFDQVEQDRMIIGVRHPGDAFDMAAIWPSGGNEFGRL